MNFFAVTFFIEGHNSQDWCEDHSRAMNPSHGLVEADRPAGFSSRHPRRADCIVSGNKVQISRHAAKSRMQVAGGCTRVLSPGVERCGNSGNQRNGCDQTHPLVNLQHVGTLIEQGLSLGVGLSLRRRKTKVVERRFCFAAGGRIRQFARRRRLLILRARLGLVLVLRLWSFLILRGRRGLGVLRCCCARGLRESQQWDDHPA